MKKREYHGMRQHPNYHLWFKMRSRCNNPNDHKYPLYGARGIKVCSRWDSSFADFIEDMGSKPEGMSLDRIDNDGNYEPSNCRWATSQTQGLNKRRQTDTTGVRKLGSNWQVRLCLGGRVLYLGVYRTRDEAVEIYEKNRKELRSMYA